MSERKFSLYLSHSWERSDIELNIWVWERLAPICNLLVDKPDTQEEHPPYYINRIEELLRRADTFVAILTHRANDNEKQFFGDFALQCSPGSVFEIRLAERANLPRLILYDRQTGFHEAAGQKGGWRYIAFDRGHQESLPEALQEIENEIKDWLEWLQSFRRPKFLEISDRSLLLLPEDMCGENFLEGIRQSLQRARYDQMDLINLQHHSDSDILRKIRTAGLLVAEVASDSTRNLYTLCHVLFVPSIRIVSHDQELPWILNGHPGGYQHDVIKHSDSGNTAKDIMERASAMFRITRPLNLEVGRSYISSRRYKGQLVFISHCLKPGQREVIDHLVQFLKKYGVPAFEYFTGNESGEEWRKKLAEELDKTTVFVPLLTNEYERSPVCTEEWDAIEKSKTKIKMLPFLLNDRTDPFVKLKGLHHQTLSRDSTDAAMEAANRIRDFIDGRP
jgi:hypothetical protein